MKFEKDSYLLMGNKALESGTYNDALHFFDTILENDPLCIEAQVGKAIGLTHVGRANEATKYIMNAMKNLPSDNVQINAERIIKHCKERGIQVTNKAGEKALDATAIFQRTKTTAKIIADAQTLENEAEICFGNATLCLDRLIQLNPQDDSLWLRKGVSLWTANKKLEAQQSFEQVLRINPNNRAATKFSKTHWWSQDSALSYL